LLIETIASIKQQIDIGLTLKWDVSLKLADFIALFAKLVDALHKEIDTVLPNREKVQMLVKSLASCEYTCQDFAAIIRDIQATVALFPVQKSVVEWLHEVNSQVQSHLRQRLVSALELWTAVLHKKREYSSDAQLAGRSEQTNTAVCIKVHYHDIRLQQQEDAFVLEPAVTLSLYALKQQLDAWIDVILSQVQISTSPETTTTLDHRALLESVPSELMHTAQSFLTLDKEVDRFVQSWTPHLLLWTQRIRSVARYALVGFFFFFSAFFLSSYFLVIRIYFIYFFYLFVELLLCP
jgi:hypothetical protein